jgi:hypothetical protein
MFAEVEKTVMSWPPSTTGLHTMPGWNKKERSEILTAWKQDMKSKVMVATTAFEAGVNISGICLVVAMGVKFFGLIHLVQMFGCAGRREEACAEAVYIGPGLSGDDGALTTLGHCCRRTVKHFLDDVHRPPCQLDKAKCDVCCAQSIASHLVMSPQLPTVIMIPSRPLTNMLLTPNTSTNSLLTATPLCTLSASDQRANPSKSPTLRQAPHVRQASLDKPPNIQNSSQVKIVVQDLSPYQSTSINRDKTCYS